MLQELEVLDQVGKRLDTQGIEFMLTGSVAMAYYATPRMTRDLDIVIALQPDRIASLVAAFSEDFYVDADAARDAVRAQRLFNLMHLESALKIDFIIRKSSPYRLEEFARRRQVPFGGIQTWIASREDLILSKLVWAMDAASELQRRDVKLLLADEVDGPYLRKWAPALNVEALLAELMP